MPGRISLGIDADNGDLVEDGKKYVPPTEKISRTVSRLARELPSVNFVLAGNQQNIKKYFDGNYPNVSILPASVYCPPDEKISHPMRNSSLNQLVNAARKEEINGFFTIGDTSKVGIESARLGRQPKVEKPVLITPIPVYPKGLFYFADIGATSLNQNAKQKDYGQGVKEFARDLYCQGIMTAVYAREAARIEIPRLGLLTIGEEEHKGSDLVQATHELFRRMQEKGLDNFLEYRGKIEPKDALEGKADIVLTDGHTGNLMLKLTESIIGLIKHAIRDSVSELSWFEKALCMPGALVLKKNQSLKQLKERFNPEEYNGAILLGYRGFVVKGHGDSSSNAIYHGIKRAASCLALNIDEKLEEALSRYMPR